MSGRGQPPQPQYVVQLPVSALAPTSAMSQARTAQLEHTQRMNGAGRMTGRWRVRHWMALIAAALAVVVTVVVVVTGNAAPEQFTLRMRPAPPLMMTECIAAAASHGYGPAGASEICLAGKDRSWYHAVLTNNGAGAYPLCSAQGFDSGGNIVFSGQLVLAFGGYPAGLFAYGHHSVSFSWYLPTVSRPVARYVATCSVNNSPPI
jgi:hypothetical protein